MAEHILVIEDDPQIADLLRRGLIYEGYSVKVAGDGPDGLAAARDRPPDLVLLDLMLPGMDGLTVCQRLRAASDVPILILTAKDSVPDRVRGLDAGADDYVVKPFAFDELLARLLALGRRTFAAASPEIECGTLRLDTATQLARVNDTVLSLTPKEYALLELLVRRKGHVLSRATIFEQLYESDSNASDTVIEVLMSTLRAKLARAGLADLIETRRGFGYVVA